MSHTPDGEAHWPAYYEKTSARPPKQFLLDTLERFDAPGHAIDLGYGAGVETCELLRQGWRVLAIDSEPSAIEHVRRAAPDQDRLEARVDSFVTMTLPQADLVWAHLSLSFVPPEQFPAAWQRVIAGLKPGGLLACDIFGDRHVWASNPEMSCLTTARVDELLADMDVVSLDEEEREAMTAFQGEQHWHAFRILARKP